MDQVRLTDEEALGQQTDEQGDLFQWFKYQAAQGVVHAQVRLVFRFVSCLKVPCFSEITSGPIFHNNHILRIIHSLKVF